MVTSMVAEPRSPRWRSRRRLPIPPEGPAAPGQWTHFFGTEMDRMEDPDSFLSFRSEESGFSIQRMGKKNPSSTLININQHKSALININQL